MTMATCHVALNIAYQSFLKNLFESCQNGHLAGTPEEARKGRVYIHRLCKDTEGSGVKQKLWRKKMMEDVEI